MAETSTSFTIDIGDTNDKSEKRRIQRKPASSFTEVLKTKYLQTPDISHGSGYVIVFQGRPRTTSENEPELAFLTNVCLSNNSIRTLGEGSLSDLCPNVVDLDISGNLLDSWKDIITILSQLSNLKFVNLARNRITYDQDVLQNWDVQLPEIENLVLNMTGASWQDVLKLSELLSALKELHVCGNGYKELPSEGHQGLHSVECLRLNDNHISRWEEIWKLSHLPNLKSLVLSGNPLADVFYKSSLEYEVSENMDIAFNAGNVISQSVHGDEACCCSCHTNGSKVNISSDICDTEADFHRSPDNAKEHCEYLLDSLIDCVVTQHADTETVTVENMSETADEQVEHTICDIGTMYRVIEQTDNVEFNEAEEGDECRRQQADVTSTFSAGQSNTYKQDQALKEGVEIPVKSNHDQGDSLNSCAGLERMHEDDPASYKVEETHEMENDDSGVISFTEGSDVDNQSIVVADSSNKTKEDDTRSCDLCCNQLEGNMRPFQSLESLCVSETAIGKWSHLGAFREFPALRSLRIKNIKLASKLTEEDRRKLFVASLPNIELLNGSEVTFAEREKSERHYLRHFCEKKQKPDMYLVLERKHGRLAPLVDIDISKGYQDYVTLGFVYKGKLAFTETVCVREPVGSLNKLIRHHTKLNTSCGLVLYHKKLNPNHDGREDDFQEIRGSAMPMSRLDFMEGDEIHIDDSNPRVQISVPRHIDRFMKPWNY